MLQLNEVYATAFREETRRYSTGEKEHPDLRKESLSAYRGIISLAP